MTKTPSRRLAGGACSLFLDKSYKMALTKRTTNTITKRTGSPMSHPTTATTGMVIFLRLGASLRSVLALYPFASGPYLQDSRLADVVWTPARPLRLTL